MINVQTVSEDYRLALHKPMSHITKPTTYLS